MIIILNKYESLKDLGLMECTRGVYDIQGNISYFDK